jgi:hypothetical protein
VRMPMPAQVPQGAWFSLGLAAILSTLCYIWQWGQGLKLLYVRQHALPLQTLLQQDRGAAGCESGELQLCIGVGGPAVLRVPGVGIYYNELLQGGCAPVTFMCTLALLPA